MIRCIVALLLTLPFISIASTPVEGVFQATDACPAYLSKRKGTNPDNLHVRQAQQYAIKEVIGHPPSWVRIDTKHHHYPLRWVHARCGTMDYQTQRKPPCDYSPGMADSHVLALNWLPGFCETHGYELGKAECKAIPPDSYHANHMVLHGLWPNQAACGIQYNFCGVAPLKTHCEYPPVNLSPLVSQKLQQYMPSYAYGSCLERHEWHKHGSCQALSADQYFTLAIRLTDEANRTKLGRFLQDHIGDIVSLSQLHQVINQSFGDHAVNKVYLSCRNGRLVELYIQLPALIPQSASLHALIQDAHELKRGQGCPEILSISDFRGDV